MNQQLRDVLERADTWPPQAQEELRRAALTIEQSLKMSATPPLTLREIMLRAPLDGVDVERHSTFPAVRGVDV